MSPVLCWLTGEKAVESSLKSNNFFPIALWLGCTYKSELIYGRVCMRRRVGACVVCECGAACVCVRAWRVSGLRVRVHDGADVGEWP